MSNRALLLLSLTAVALPFQDEEPAATAALPLAIERPAPDLGLEDWVGAEDKPSNVVRKVVGDAEGLEGLDDLDKLLGKGDPGELAGYHGKVVLIHLVIWNDPVTSGDLVSLVRDLVRANEDRDLEAIAIASAGEGTKEAAERAGVTWSIATTDVKDSPSPYVDLDANERTHVFLIGRSGELVWQGDPLEQEKAFFGAVNDALNRTKLSRIERALDEELGDALDEYYPGRLAKAATLAEKVKTAAERDENLPLKQDAQLLVDKIRDGELDWLRTMRETSTRRSQFGKFLTHVDALVAAFPKTSGKEAKAREKELSREGHNLARLKEERRWLELHAKRHALFPARKNRAGDRFAKEIQKFLDKTNNDTDATRRAQDLLDRYRVASE